MPSVSAGAIVGIVFGAFCSAGILGSALVALVRCLRADGSRDTAPAQRLSRPPPQ